MYVISQPESMSSHNLKACHCTTARRVIAQQVEIEALKLGGMTGVAADMYAALHVSLYICIAHYKNDEHKVEAQDGNT